MTVSRTLSLHPAIAGTTNLTLTLDFGRSFEQQIRDFFEKAPDLRDYENYGLPGQSVAAVLTLPVLEMACGFPVTPIYDIGKREVVGNLDLGNFRHAIVRPRRSELSRGEAYTGYTVIDGAGRGLTDLQRKELEEILGTTNIRVVSAPTGHVDFTDPTKDIVDTLIATGLTFEDWTSGRVIYLPAGMGLSAVVQTTAIYGLSEIWPRTIRLNRHDDQQFHFDELVDPQAVRQFGVSLQTKWQTEQPRVTLSGNLPEAFRTALAALAAEHGVEVRG